MIHSLFRRLVDSFEVNWNKGERVQQYLVINTLGKGSYGTAYTVQHIESGNLAILKRIRPYKKYFSDHEQYIDNETTVLSKLHHPQFPAIYETGRYKRTPYFIMERMNGKTFEDLIFKEGKTYSEKESLDVGLKLINLIIDIHQHGYIHRDLRIPNILWNNGVLNIIDFGLACKIEMKSEKEPMYHKEYMREKTAKSDLYALGHFLLFLLYSSYVPNDRKEKSWEDELNIRKETRMLLRKLLRIGTPFETAEEARGEMIKIIHLYQKNR
ncbi:protein kinase family protein [Bacillus haikouensis]|uniref:protein kinase family protein n=1 Tax=Bacillus haikouensis TaxID=1510468 RepID=UPI0015518CD3|nr:protein kinase family protein [Bacillus haikouensis]NQD67678.1 protein kinase family protein [Bacillus haikouensis]